MRLSVAVAGALAFLLLNGGAAPKTSAQRDVTLPPPPLALDLRAAIAPRKLSPRKPTPVGLTLSARVWDRRGSIPPGIREFSFATDRQAGINVTGLPVCGLRQLRPLNTESVEAACRGAVVGSGVGKAMISYPESSPIPAISELVVYNGGANRRVTTLFVRGVIGLPISRSVVAPITIERDGDGSYGLRTTTRIPALADGHGHVTNFELHIARRYRADGTRRSVLSSTCADGKLLAESRMVLEDSTTLIATTARTCTPRSAAADN